MALLEVSQTLFEDKDIMRALRNFFTTFRWERRVLSEFGKLPIMQVFRVSHKDYGIGELTNDIVEVQIRPIKEEDLFSKVTKCTYTVVKLNDIIVDNSNPGLPPCMHTVSKG